MALFDLAGVQSAPFKLPHLCFVPLVERRSYSACRIELRYGLMGIAGLLQDGHVPRTQPLSTRRQRHVDIFCQESMHFLQCCHRHNDRSQDSLPSVVGLLLELEVRSGHWHQPRHYRQRASWLHLGAQMVSAVQSPAAQCHSLVGAPLQCISSQSLLLTHLSFWVVSLALLG